MTGTPLKEEDADHLGLDGKEGTSGPSVGLDKAPQPQLLGQGQGGARLLLTVCVSGRGLRAAAAAKDCSSPSVVSGRAGGLKQS